MGIEAPRLAADGLMLRRSDGPLLFASANGGIDGKQHGRRDGDIGGGTSYNPPPESPV
jgi:hypothetical protein